MSPPSSPESSSVSRLTATVSKERLWLTRRPISGLQQAEVTCHVWINQRSSRDQVWTNQRPRVTCGPIVAHVSPAGVHGGVHDEPGDQHRVPHTCGHVAAGGRHRVARPAHPARHVELTWCMTRHMTRDMTCHMSCDTTHYTHMLSDIMTLPDKTASSSLVSSSTIMSDSSSSLCIFTCHQYRDAMLLTVSRCNSY